MRKKYLLIMLLVISMTMTSCGSINQNNGDLEVSDGSKIDISNSKDAKKVEKQVVQYFDNLLERNYEEAYNLLSSKEKEVMSLEEFQPEEVDTGDESYDDIVKKIDSLYSEYSSYNIKNVLKVEDHYEVEVSQDLLNKEELFFQLPRNGLLLDSLASIEFLAGIKSKDQVPMMEVETIIKLVKEDSEFKINLGRYDELQESKKGLASYGEYIEIIDEDLNRYDDSAFISGNLKNYGDKIIDYVMLEIKYLDDKGDILYQELSKSYISKTDNNDIIMKPNYISSFIFSVPKNILSDWNSDYELEIVGLNFLDNNEINNPNTNIDESLVNQIDIDYDMNIYDDSAFIDFTLTNNTDETIKLIKLKVYYLDNDDKAILENIITPNLKDGDYSNTEIPSDLKGAYLLKVPDNILKYWGEKIRVEIVELEI